MKSIFLILAFINSFNFFGNEIDQLKSTKEVQEFISSVEISMIQKFPHVKYELLETDSLIELTKCRELLDESQVKNWEKTNLNNDGRTDLLIILSAHSARYTFLIHERNPGNYQSTLLSSYDCEFLKPINIDGLNYIQSYSISEHPSAEIQVDTLVYKFDKLIRKQHNPATYNIKSISLYEGGGEMVSQNRFEIKENGSGIISRSLLGGKTQIQRFNFANEKFKLLEIFLSYINILDFNDEYALQALDVTEWVLTIQFEDSSMKTIRNIGHGTVPRDLMVFYRKVYDIIAELEQTINPD